MPNAAPAATPAAASPFQRLRELLRGMAPGRPPIDMSIGEPRHAMPAFVGEMLAREAAGFGRYPPIRGTDALARAIAAWLGRRYPPCAGAIDPETQVLPLAGSREGLFSATFTARARKPRADRILVPNPFYPAYAAAAVPLGLKTLALPARRETGFLPDLEALRRSDLSRAAALYLASPSNPQGAVAGADYLGEVVALARANDVMLFADECYSEVYTGAAPPGALEAALAASGDTANVIVFNSLSKRSNLPGLRSGFCAGDPDFIAAFATFRNVAGPQLPLPVCAVSAAVWDEETHVEASRALYRAKFDAADRILAGRFGHARPAGAFFLWLDTAARGGSETATKTLWQECGVRVVPGAYLARDDAGGNPGTDFIRVALVDDLATTEEGLARIVACLG